MNGQRKVKTGMDVDEDEQTESPLSFLDVNNLDTVSSSFKMKSVRRSDIDAYIELFNEKYDAINNNVNANKMRMEKAINCSSSNKSKSITFRVSVCMMDLFVMEIKYIQQRKGDAMIDNINILEWNEYKFKRKNMQNNQCIVQLSQHCLFQKLTVNCRIFHKQINKKMRSKKNEKKSNINPTIIILHRLMIWLNEYNDLYTASCDGCSTMLAFDSDQYGLLLPTIRIRDNDTICAYHIGCIPIMM